ncbi:Outer membrane protein, OmpA/MotB family [Stenotrophomonas acidaminiphila]|uniref:Outer membrane protein, OmpA/MotB family n=1 Tax=Stenotrophomonas acidaminiphila TaxID=128780 RepID=A0A0S1B4U4_9GAMM|nr:OmpA family protein [Stenotrophomonas acidaminiphila]ALJ29990.1 Outer membrane protein, OmpA/MotB family [Stenotrophomonas acidaminiphila]
MTLPHTRSTLSRVLLATALLSALAGPAAAQQTRLNAQEKRITDEAIHADLQGYEATQGRIQALNDGGRPVRDYHLSKAQCWLDVSFHEYTRNDRSAFPQEALTESEKLIVAMETGVSPIPTDTPLVNNAKYLRDDLWQRLKAIHGTPGFSCAQQAVACGEVELVHAGNEFNQQQWRHSKPYIQIAEDLVNDAEAMARQCAVAPAAAAPTPGPLIANVLFEFDRDGRKDIRTYSLESIDRALATLAGEQRELAGVTLVGHADRMQGKGFDYNQGLSQRRAQTVRELLIGRGIAADRIRYEYRGDTQQVQQCDGVKPRAALLECLLPNRRVEVRFELAR